MGKAASCARILAATAPLFLSGCFSYVPADVGSLPVGDDVRLELTRVAFAELPELPDNSGPDLNGTLVRRDADRLFVRVPVNVRMGGFVTQTVHQELTIPSQGVVQSERRVLSRTRTGLTVAGGVAALAVIFVSFKDSDESPELPERTPEEEAGVGFIRRGLPLPFVSIPWP